jgi:hypothetical protein
MTPENMTDEQLVAPREITACVEVDAEIWNVTFSCGHDAVFVTRPPMKLQACSQCVDILIERHKHGRK